MRWHRIILGLCIVGSIAAAVHGSESPATGARRPNVLFLVADDLAVRLGCYGDDLARTPRLDGLAASGVVFTHAYCQGAVCTPSRTSFMLGLDNSHAHPDHFRKHPGTVTLGRWFREHGYQTFAVGKIDHTEDYVDPGAWEIRVPMTAIKPTGGLRRRKLDEDLPQPDGTMLERNFSSIGVADSDGQLHDAVVADRAIRFLAKERDPGRPFFAAVGFHSPHVSWDSTSAEHDAHDASRFRLEKTPADATPLPPKALLREPGLALSDDLARDSVHGYYAAVTLLDRQVGRVLDRLEAEGFVELVDLFPTFCDAAGLPRPEQLDGRSFVPLLQDPTLPGKPAAFCRWGNGRTVRTARWRYTERADGSTELYDHESDPQEYHDVGDMPAHAEVVHDHASLLEAAFGSLPDRRPGR